MSPSPTRADRHPDLAPEAAGRPHAAAPTTPRSRHGAHRAGRSAAAAVLPSLLAVAAVAALITSLAVWQAEEPVRQPGAAAATSSAEQTTGGGADPSAGTVSAAPSPSAPSASVTATPSQSAPAEEDAAGFTVEVVVLNQTTRAGLASDVAERLRGEGWVVPAVGNFTGVVPATTVYYPPGEEAAALAVAADLPVEPRLRPRFGNLSTSRLTVVVTSSYPG